MEQWYIFLIGFGALLIVMSYQMPNPLLLILSGLMMAGFGAYKVWGGKKK